MSATITSATQLSSVPGNSLWKLKVTPGLYSVGGITLDLSTYFSTTVHCVDIVGKSGVIENYHCTTRIVDESDPETGVKILIQQTGFSIYDNDSAEGAGRIAYIDEDQSLGHLAQFVSPTDTTAIQKEQLQEVGDGRSFPDSILYIRVEGD